MAIWVHVIRFSFFIFKLKNEWPFGYTHYDSLTLRNLNHSKIPQNLRNSLELDHFLDFL